jgi:hypothetical protein
MQSRRAASRSSLTAPAWRYAKSRKMPANNLILIFERSKNKDDVSA